MVVSLLDEVRKVDLGDKRLNKRLGKIIEELGDNPNLSIPGATHSRAEMEAAYRFLITPKFLHGGFCNRTSMPRLRESLNVISFFWFRIPPNSI